jgi:hypothetical protein
MANRNFNRKQALDKEIKEIYAKVSVGASGAPTMDASRSVGVASVARNSAGRYTITLQDAYMHLHQLSHSLQFAAGAPASAQMVIRSEAVDTAKTIVVEFLDASGAAVDVDSGTILRFKFDLKNSSVI